MAEPASSRDVGDDAVASTGGAGGESPPPVPRWVKALAMAALLVGAVLVVLLLIGDGDHGPGRHTQGGGQVALAAGDGTPAG